MRINLYKGQALKMALVTCLAFLLGLTGSALAQHPTVDLLDANGQPVPAVDGLAPAYSSTRTCGGCHTYANIEQHSYHAQIGANQFFGWNNFNPNSPNKFKKRRCCQGQELGSESWPLR